MPRTGFPLRTRPPSFEPPRSRQSLREPSHGADLRCPALLSSPAAVVGGSIAHLVHSTRAWIPPLIAAQTLPILGSVIMNRARVYGWFQDPAHPLHGRVKTKRVGLKNLDETGEGKGRLWGKFVLVRNAGWLNE